MTPLINEAEKSPLFSASAKSPLFSDPAKSQPFSGLLELIFFNFIFHRLKKSTF